MNDTTDATAIFDPLWRRKWLILAVGVIVAAASYAYYKGASRVYESSTQIFLGAGVEEQVPGEKVSAKSPTADIGAEATIINSIIIEKVRAQLLKENQALIRGAKVRAKAIEKSEFITITTEAHTARGAALLTNGTAQAFISRQGASRRRATERAIAIARRQLHRIELTSTPVVAPKAPTTAKGSGTTTAPAVATAKGPSSTSILQAAALSSKINQLEASLSTAGAQQIRPAKPANAVLLSPKPRKNAIFGFVIGIVLAAIAAYVLARADRRLRSLAGIESVFHSRILAGFPKVKRPIVQREGQPAPSRFLLEPLRRLHTALQLGVTARDEGQPSSRVVLFVSADAGDGKSVLLADLALVQRDAGERVAVVEANFRRPAQARLLGLDGEHGLADVLTGGLSVEQAIQRVRPVHVSGAPDPHGSAAPVATAVETDGAGSLFLLAGGGAVANPPALLAHEAMSDLLRSVATEFDYVLIDAPSPLEVSDIIPLLGAVDAVVIVARAGHTREMSAQRLAQLLAQSNAPVLGIAANCVARKDIERYGFSTPNGWSAKLMGR